ncbi:MAG: ABC transporter ATP-binding protein [Bacillota bacterium]|nr:ABC transporter ATP-binding protein [Bacillota bacterium]
METILKVNRISKKNILKNVSFSIEQGEMVAIMGPSGSGKSTLLYIVSGMDSPDFGEVFLKKEELTAMNEDQKADLRLHKMGFVFQQMNMMENLNLLDNILLPAHALRKEKKELKKEALDWMKKLSIEGLESRKINEVSGGQLQRACICRSLINHPDILFADEPTGALNQKASQEVLDTMVSLNQEGTTICMVTHDARMASRCQRILYLVDGQIHGELFVPEHLSIKQREEKVNQWLNEFEW